jgi:phosphatidylserine decarboxylase
MSQSIEVTYRNRETGEVVAEPLLYETAQRWIYERPMGLTIFDCVLNNRPFCWLYGKWQNMPWSRRKISEFADRYGMDVEEVELPLNSYRSFNDFFSRRLKPEARPFASAPDVFSAPAEGKVLVYPCLVDGTRIPVKGAPVTLASLLGSTSVARPYFGGSALIIRLAPYDYHRFHFPDAGEAGPARCIPGTYYVVNPLGLARVPDVFCRNKRKVTEFVSDHFGRVAYVEIGGFAVASIMQTYAPGRVGRGQEKGYFQYGGSTIVLLFEPGTIVFDGDLLRDSANGLEVHVKVGSGIGRHA